MSRKKKDSQNHKAVHNNTSSDAAKKAAVLGSNDKKKRPALWVYAACVLVLAAGTAGFVLWNSQADQVKSQDGVQVTADRISFPVSTFNDGKARHYSYRSPDGITVRYFIIKSSDGVIRAAFDACDVCWRSNKGYTQEGDFMVCNNCGRRFASIKVNEIKGGCNPAPLRRSLVNNRLVIKTADILTGRRFFNFST